MPTNLFIPYVIDNQTHRMADVLRSIAEHRGRSLDVPTAYFNVQGFRLLRDGLLGLRSFRLLLGMSRPMARAWACGPEQRAR